MEFMFENNWPALIFEDKIVSVFLQNYGGHKCSFYDIY